MFAQVNHAVEQKVKIEERLIVDLRKEYLVKHQKRQVKCLHQEKENLNIERYLQIIQSTVRFCWLSADT